MDSSALSFFLAVAKQRGNRPSSFSARPNIECESTSDVTSEVIADIIACSSSISLWRSRLYAAHVLISSVPSLFLDSFQREREPEGLWKNPQNTTWKQCIRPSDDYKGD